MFIGNQRLKTHFEGLIKSGNLGHAYLFHGPEGVGKRTLALELAKQVSGPLDTKIIDKGGDQILISDIRELKEFIYLTPFGSRKIALINNAHNLTSDASNALLKVLEEPPGKSVVFLVSHLPGQIVETVVSRCQAWRFGPLNRDEIYKRLIAGKTKQEIALTVSEMANGSMGTALAMADNFTGFKKNADALEKLMKADFALRFELSKKLAADYESFRETARDWLIYSAARKKSIAGQLLRLNNIVSRPQFNHRLALDDFLITAIPVGSPSP